MIVVSWWQMYIYQFLKKKEIIVELYTSKPSILYLLITFFFGALQGEKQNSMHYFWYKKGLTISSYSFKHI